MSHTPTPTPWHVNDDGISFSVLGEYIGGCSGRARDNAEHIVRCVNNHDELVAALKECADRFEKCIKFSGSDPEYAGLAVSAYRTLLARATA